jgi:hypothetical protein
MKINMIVYGILFTSIFSQANDLYGQDKTESIAGDHKAQPCFGELTSGYVTIEDALDDSLAFTDSLINERMQIVSFNLALKCNGNTVKYLENKSGNKLTPEMKEAIQKLHQNCSLNFDGIKSRTKSKDIHGKYTETKHRPLKITLK